MPRRSSPLGRAAAVACGLVLAAAIVAVAGRYPLSASAPVNAASAQAPISALFIVLTAAGLLALVGLAIVMWPGRRRKGDDEPEYVSEPPPVHWIWKVIAILLPFALAAALIAAVVGGTHALHGHRRPLGGSGLAAPTLPLPHPRTAPAQAPRSFVLPGWLPWTALAILVLAAFAAAVFAYRRRSRTPQPGDERMATRRAVEAAITALDPHSDPRTAVIAAYGAMQETLATEGMPRGPAEAPREYLQRALVAGSAPRHDADALTGLFEEARFSRHSVSAQMRDAAFRRLSQLRAELTR